MVTATSIPLLGVTLNHDYYAGAFSAFAPRPLAATAQACRDLGLCLVQNGPSLGLALLANSVARLASSAYRAKLAAQSLCWEIIPSDSRFAAFTGVDFAGPAQALVLAPGQNGKRNGLLTSGAAVSASDVWTRQPLRFDYRPTQPLSPRAKLSLQCGSGQQLRAVTVSDPAIVPVDVSDFGSGLYQLADGRTVLARWFADERAPLSPINGPVLVIPGSLLESLPLSSSTRGGAAPPSFTTTFPTRPVVWRYHIFNAPAGASFTITTDPADTPADSTPAAGSIGTTFHPLPKPVLPGAQSFESTRPLPLAAQPTQRFALNRDGAPICAPLPVAGFDFARPPGGSAIRSDIFVYL